MINRLFLAALIASSGINAMDIKKEYTLMPCSMCNASLRYDGNHFTVNDIVVPPYRTDKELRGISKEVLIKMLSAGSYIAIKENGDNNFNISLQGRLLGAGPGGATFGFYAGKFVTHFVGHSIILVVSVCTGPAAPATMAALEATFMPVIEATSNVVGLAAGVAGAVVTGPI